VADGNPGATNVLRAGGPLIAGPALALDFAKGWLPVAIAYLLFELDGFMLILVAIAPVAGHAFTPWLGFRGGKAVATTGGIWAALTAWEGPAVGGFALLLFCLYFGTNGKAVLCAVALMLLYLLLTPPAWNGLYLRPSVEVIAGIGLLNLGILAWKHRRDLGFGS
jgi:acyl phosphate:glycerol-3-phosphate acyltransferase